MCILFDIKLYVWYHLNYEGNECAKHVSYQRGENKIQQSETADLFDCSSVGIVVVSTHTHAHTHTCTHTHTHMHTHAHTHTHCTSNMFLFALLCVCVLFFLGEG